MNKLAPTAWSSGFALLLAVGAALTGLHPVYEVDAFFQLQLGRAVVTHGSRLVPEPSALSAFTEPCLAFEWLWGVLLHGVIGVAGPAGLTWLAVLLGGCAVWVTWRYLRGGRDPLGDHPVAALVLLSLASLAIASRVKARPQVLFMVLIPGVLWLVERLVWADRVSTANDARSHKRRLLGAAGLVGLTVLWAQLHASFVLVPGIYLATAVQRHLDDGFERPRARFDALVLAVLSAAMLTSAAGLSLLPYLLAHGGGDAASHIREMSPTVWSGLSPFAAPHHAALFIVWTLGSLGVVRAGRLQLGPLLLALGGAFLLWRAQRFIAAASLLGLPLARIGVTALLGMWDQGLTRRLRFPVLTLVMLCCGSALAHQARLQARTRGPLGGAGWTAGAHPVAALAVLDPGSGSRREVLTDYRAGPALSYWSEGRIRSYVDGRTPQYFDDTDFAVARTLFGSEEALLRGLRRYRPDAAVVRRRGSCIAFKNHWRLVAMDPMYSTFLPPPAEAAGEAEDRRPTLEGLAPCGERYVTEETCASERASRSLTELRRHAEPAFSRYLDAAYRFRCHGEVAPALAIRAGDDTWGFRVALRRLQAEAAVASGDVTRALVLMDAALDEGDAAVVQLMPPGFAAVVGASPARVRLERALAIMDDASPAALRADLALVCAAQHDLECSRFQGLRAAASGERRAIPALQLVASKHPRAQVRRDAAAWLEVLGGQAPTRPELTPSGHVDPRPD